MTADQARELASVCRGHFGAGNLRQREDWSYLLMYRAHPTTPDSEGELLSFLLLDTDTLPVATLRFLCAKDSGTGVPQALVQRAEDLAREEGATTLELELVRLAPKLIAVYTKMGFTQESKNPLFMSKPLKGGARRSRVKKQTRRAQRKRRNTVRK